MRRCHLWHLQIGPELPEPSVVAWDPTLRYLALAYLRQVQIFRAQPHLESLGSLPIAGTTSVSWGVRQLYLATPTSLLVAFISAEEGPQGGFSLLDGPLGYAGGRKSGASTLQFVQLAALTGTTATSSLRADSSGADASLPGPCARPAGPVALLGPRQGNLWLVNSLGQPVLVPLSHPGGAAHSSKQLPAGCVHIGIDSGWQLAHSQAASCTQAVPLTSVKLAHGRTLMLWCRQCMAGGHIHLSP